MQRGAMPFPVWCSRGAYLLICPTFFSLSAVQTLLCMTSHVKNLHFGDAHHFHIVSLKVDLAAPGIGAGKLILPCIPCLW